MTGPFKAMDEIVNEFFSQPVFRQPSIAYCDYIAHLISKELKAVDSERLLSSVGRPQFDVDGDGAYRSTKKTIAVEDRFGKKYLVTIEEA